MGLSGEVAPHAPLSRDVKEGEPYQIQGELTVPDLRRTNRTSFKEGESYQIQGELTVPILRAPGPSRFKEGETVQDPKRGTVPYSRVKSYQIKWRRYCIRSSQMELYQIQGGGTVPDLGRRNCTRSREGNYTHPRGQCGVPYQIQGGLNRTWNQSKEKKTKNTSKGLNVGTLPDPRGVSNGTKN